MNFAKLHGAGNDFLVFDGAVDPALVGRLPAQVARLCDRHAGLGADGVLLVVPEGGRRCRLHYWNSDGSQAAFCANGTRCAARFAAARWGLDELVIVTGYAAVAAKVRGEQVTLDLPPPSEVRPWRSFQTAVGTVAGRFAAVGVPQLVVVVDWDDFWSRALAPLAPALRHHGELAPEGANVNLVRVSGGELWVRSWERGVEGETLSCGSGDVAAALIAAADGWLAPPVTVRTASGRTLVVTPRGVPPHCPIRLAGPAEWVADGTVSPELLVGT